MADPQDPTTPPPGGQQLPLGGDGGGKTSIPINIEDEMKRSYLDYSMSVIIGRALPDVRDGLKPVHRRILFGMHEMGLHYNRPTRKCAKDRRRSAGSKYHPHGAHPGLRCVGAHGVQAVFRCGTRWWTWAVGKFRFGRWAGDPAGGGCAVHGSSPIAHRRLLECSKISTRKPSISALITTKVKSSRRFCRHIGVPNLLINGSERHRGGAWRARSLPTTSPRLSKPASCC